MCGIIGITGTEAAAHEVYKGLLTLQHRGQDAAGILSYDLPTHQFFIKKGPGLITEVFQEHHIPKLKGTMSVGHVRYATVGSGGNQDIQPLLTSYPFGLGMVHNGNLVNYLSERERLREQEHFNALTSNDLEVIQGLLIESLMRRDLFSRAVMGMTTADMLAQLVAAVGNVMKKAQGGYSVLGLWADQGLFAFRDPLGLRPLILGKRVGVGKDTSTSYCLTSESSALNFLGYEFVRDVLPGELIFVGPQGEFFAQKIVAGTGRPCMFEWVYFSSHEGKLEGKSIYSVRERLGQNLAEIVQKRQIRPDIIVPIPDTGRVAALSLAEALHIPYREVLIKNRYVYRSFILKTQKERERAVELKLAAVASEIVGRDVLLIDDSIVRGTTICQIIKMVRRCGARKVYVGSTCPPVRYPCFYGIDFPDHHELIAHGREEEEVARLIGADAVIYLDIPGLLSSLELTNKNSDKNSDQDIATATVTDNFRPSACQQRYCMACLTGEYPVGKEEGEKFRRWRAEHKRN